MTIARELRVHPVGEHIALPQPGHIGVQAIDVRHAATQHDHIRVEDVDDVRERARQAVLVELQSAPCIPVTRGGARNDFGRREYGARGRGVTRGHPRTRQIGFDATLPAAAAVGRSPPRQKVRNRVPCVEGQPLQETGRTLIGRPLTAAGAHFQPATDLPTSLGDMGTLSPASR